MTARNTTFCLALLLVAAPTAIEAQTRLTLQSAIARATTNGTDVRVLTAAEREASARVEQARAGFLPTVDFSETWQRGTLPLFVFSSLVAQRSVAGFGPDALDHSTALSNYRSAFTVDAPIFNATTGASLHGAKLGAEIAAVQREAAQHDATATVVSAYGAVVNAVAMRRVVAASLDAARADLTIAEQRRDQGLVTDADVLQVQLHLASTREREIRAAADEIVARAHLNQVMGAPLDERFDVDDVTEPTEPAIGGEGAEAAAVQDRPEARLAVLNQSLADSTRDAARAVFLPQVSAIGSWEANGGQWDSRASGWTVGVVARVNLFRGFADRARLAEVTALQHRRAIEREGVETAVRVDVRETRARLDAARATVDVAEAAVAQAVESHRIIRDRYQGGLADVSALLRAAEGVTTAEAGRIAARVEVIVATAAWQRATGR